VRSVESEWRAVNRGTRAITRKRSKGAPDPHQSNRDGRKEGEGKIMHDVEALIIWSALNIAGMMLAMLMPHIVSDSPGSGRKHDQLVRVPSAEGISEENAAMVEIGKAA
jgi:hypothetical protein